MIRHTYALLVVVAAAVLAALAVAPGVLASEVVAIDYSHDLDDEQTIEQYEETGVASDEITAPTMNVTVADDREDVGRDSVIFDSDTYLRVQYHEDIERSIRIYVPTDYWEPFEDHNLESLDGGVDGEMEPVRVNGQIYSAVTLHFDGETDAVVAIDGVESSLWDIRHTGTDMLNDTVPFALPSLSSPDKNPWEYVDSNDFSTGNYDTKSGDVMVEYDRKQGDSNETAWVEAPSCDSSAPVCTMERGGNVTIVPDDANDPPAVRYKTDPTMRDNIGTGFRSITAEVSGIIDGAKGVFG